VAPPRALQAPAGDLVVLTRELADRALAHARSSPRRRVILPFHKTEAEPLHRMLNAIQPDSYMRPHRHLDPPKYESFLVLQGELAFFTFEDDGRVRDCLHLAAGGERFGVDLVPGIWHTVVALVPDTVVYEVKTGPYLPANDKAFAPWAPAEGDVAAAGYLQRLRDHFGRR
jgi:cupin fold WbuC family metalloprotein